MSLANKALESHSLESINIELIKHGVFKPWYKVDILQLFIIFA